MINPKMISALESIKTSKGYRVVVYVDGKKFDCTLPFEDLMKLLKDNE